MKLQFAAVGNLFARVAREDDGGEIIEYALTLGFISASSYVAIQVIGVKVSDLWARLDQALNLAW